MQLLRSTALPFKINVFSYKTFSQFQALSQHEGHTRLVVNKLKTQDRKLHTHITLFSSIVHKWYVVVTYQPHAHNCDSCKRYVVDTYRCIIVTPCRKHVHYTCNSGELIQIGMEQLRNKRIFIYFPYCKFILLSSAIFLTTLASFYINPPFSSDLCSNSNQDWQCQQGCNN